MPRLNLLKRPQPGIGIIAAAAGWALSHQVGSQSAFDGCQVGSLVTVAASLVGLALTVSGGLYCLLGLRRSEESGLRILASIGIGVAALGAFAIVLQIAAGLIIPQCVA